MSENKTKGLTSKQKRAVRTNVVGYAFILPNLIGYSIFVFLPVCFSFVLSVMKWDASQAPMEFVGLQNFAQILGDDIFRKSFVNTVEYAALTVVPTLILALLLAVLLNSKIKGIAFFRTSFFFPYIASIVAVGAVWNMLFQPDFGPINEMLKFLSKNFIEPFQGNSPFTVTVILADASLSNVNAIQNYMKKQDQ
ncbi:MAG: sugar ABC transporter permease, partial [Hungatella sp.]